VRIDPREQKSIHFHFEPVHTLLIDIVRPRPTEPNDLQGREQSDEHGNGVSN